MRISNIWKYGIISGDGRSDSLDDKSYTRSEKTRYI